MEAAGADVRGLRPGDEVLGLCRGAFGEYARAEAAKVVPKAVSLTFGQAAVPMAWRRPCGGSGKLTPVLDRTYPLAGTAEGLHRVEQGHARGKVAITVA